MRLIDAHKLYEQYETAMRELVKSINCENISLEALSLLCGANLIANAPTVDAVPVVHGRWEKTNNPSYSPFDGSSEHLSICSNCAYSREQHDFLYCPNCGACMDLEEQDAKEET